MVPGKYEFYLLLFKMSVILLNNRKTIGDMIPKKIAIVI